MAEFRTERDSMGTIQAEQCALGTAEHHLLHDEAPLGLWNRFLPFGREFYLKLGFVIFKRQDLILGQALTGGQKMVGSNSIYPCGKLTLLPEAVKSSDNLYQDLLCGIFRIGGIPEHPKSQPVNPVLYPQDQEFKCLFITVFGLLNDIFERCFHV